ncbi:Lipoyltransferase and lipoate-protein ligase [Meira miltonrushii]|uniref:Putative lipoate-protein ligase A n=1 Tax=Meira miltonrushii TaxID=1280837 RepID=A0A316V3H8_9BASI|nr:Lipoyltransferase and lipoate-protein ligase [Meira miltonrushii]PWN32109.1 Lipoyltransferase and lipoate-protein ligase [Meira miltonrushii]
MSATSAGQQIARAFISKSHHPHLNLSIEHYLLRSQPAIVPVAFLYRNQPCIVIGRNQNPWHELDVTRMRELGIRLVRRRSGGGAVYHDLGNTNYSFHIAREKFTRRTHAELIARALNSDPVNLKAADASDVGDTNRGAFVNDRNDICVALRKSKTDRLERKISGSAYKIISSRAYHHGTMLLSANLSDLGSALRPMRADMDSKGVASVSSPVINLVEAFPSRKSHLTHDAFCQSVLSEFKRTYGGDSSGVEYFDDHFINDEIKKGWEEMDSWDWTFGQTPEFTHKISSTGFKNPDVAPFTINLHVKHGKIQEANLNASESQTDENLHKIVQRLKGARYDILADAPDTFGKSVESTPESELSYNKQGAPQREAGILTHFLPWLKTVL